MVCSKIKKNKVFFLSEWLKNPYKDLLAKHLESEGLEVREDLWKTLFLLEVLYPWKPNILHLHALHPFLRGRSTFSKNVKFCLFVVQIFLLKLLGIKTVWTVHEWADKLDTGSSEISPNHAAVIGRVLYAFIAHCESTKDDIVNTFQLSNSKKAHFIPHGNYIGFYENQVDQHQARQLLGIPDEHVSFLIFGGLYRYKGVLEALSAFKQLTSDQVTLIIAGKPSEKGLKEEIEAEIESCSKQVIFVPERIPDADVQLYMNACDCVVMPYKVFTTSGVAVLAMSFGRVCIAPQIGFFQDIFEEDGAFLYEIDDPAGLTKALSRTITNRVAIPSMAQRNLELAKTWSWQFVADRTISVYE